MNLYEKYSERIKQAQEKYKKDEEFRIAFNRKLGTLLFLMGRDGGKEETEEEIRQLFGEKNDNSETETNK